MSSRLLNTVLLLNLWAGVTLAQEKDLLIPDGQALGFTIDRFSEAADDMLIGFTFHITQLKRWNLGPDLGIGSFPAVLADRHLALPLDANVAFNISLPMMTILPRGGASTMLLAGSEAHGLGIGYNFGVSVLFNFNARSAIRFDIYRREYLGDAFRGRFLTIGIGVSGVPPRRKGPTQ
jgi:hypothetical protein